MDPYTNLPLGVVSDGISNFFDAVDPTPPADSVFSSLNTSACVGASAEMLMPQHSSGLFRMLAALGPTVSPMA